VFWCKERDEIKGLMGDGNVSARSAPSVYLVKLGAQSNNKVEVVILCIDLGVSINDIFRAYTMATAGPGPSTTAQALLLPGQPIPSSLIKDKPVLGSGCYEQGGKVLSSVVGRPRRDGAVSYSHLWRVVVESVQTGEG
jgi:hypothetical protein